jgi:hypothetical protein
LPRAAQPVTAATAIAATSTSPEVANAGRSEVCDAIAVRRREEA